MEQRYNALLKIDLQTLISYFLILVLLQKRRTVMANYEDILQLYPKARP